MCGYVGITTYVTIGHIIVHIKKVNIQKCKYIKVEIFSLYDMKYGQIFTKMQEIILK